MLHKVEKIALLVALSLIAAAPLLHSQVALDEQLKAQYTMLKMGSDSSGVAVVEPGTLLDIKKGGVLGVPYSDTSFTPTKYQDGQVHSPNALVQKGLGSFMKKIGKEQNTRLFQIGEKVYASHLEVNMTKDQVTLGVVSCDSCNNVNPPTYYKADVVFQFAKGQLAKMSAPQVEDTISALFALDEGGDQGQGGGGQQQANNQGGAAGPAGPPQQQAPPPEPEQIEKGQTTDQVRGALGQPDKIVNLGAKQIFVYKDLKVTFVNGKVSDVQ